MSTNGNDVNALSMDELSRGVTAKTAKTRLEVLDYIIMYCRQREYSLDVKDVASNIGKSRSVVNNTLAYFEKKGLIERLPYNPATKQTIFDIQVEKVPNILTNKELTEGAPKRTVTVRTAVYNYAISTRDNGSPWFKVSEVVHATKKSSNAVYDALRWLDLKGILNSDNDLKADCIIYQYIPYLRAYTNKSNNTQPPKPIAKRSTPKKTNKKPASKPKKMLVEPVIKTSSPLEPNGQSERMITEPVEHSNEPLEKTEQPDNMLVEQKPSKIKAFFTRLNPFK